MAQKKISFVCLYLSYAQTLSPYTDEERGRIMTAMLEYAATGTIPDFSGSEKYIWPSIQAQIDRDMEDYRQKCETNHSNGKKGGRPKKQTVISETERFSEKPKKPKDNDKDNDRDKDSESIGADKPPTRSRFSPPGVDEVRAYCAEKGYSIDPEHFVDHYTANGWKVGKAPMKDWKAAVRNWDRKDKENGHGKQGRPASGYVDEEFPNGVPWTVL